MLPQITRTAHSTIEHPDDFTVSLPYDDAYNQNDTEPTITMQEYGLINNQSNGRNLKLPPNNEINIIRQQNKTYICISVGSDFSSCDHFHVFWMAKFNMYFVEFFVDILTYLHI